MSRTGLLVIALIAAFLIIAGCIGGGGDTVPPPVTVYFFYGAECPHCHNVMPFIENLSTKYPEVDFRILETWHNEANHALFISMNQQLGIQSAGVPEVIVSGNSTPLMGDRDIPVYLESVLLEQLQKK